VLVLANLTAASPELAARLQGLAAEAPTRFLLLVPASADDGGQGRALTWEEHEVWDAATERMRRAVTGLAALGLVMEGRVGDADALNAVQDLLQAEPFELLVVSTFPETRSSWLRLDLPDRLARATRLPIVHVVAQAELVPG
jgi:hypothetical protein